MVKYLKILLGLAWGIAMWAFMASAAHAQGPQCGGAELSPASQQMSGRFFDLGGETILLLSGPFDKDAYDNVRNKISQRSRYSEVWLCSGGGAVSQGMAIGEALTNAQATVRIPNGFVCASSCTIATMGGFIRIIEPGAEFVLHSSSSYMDLSFNDYVAIDCSDGQKQQLCANTISDIRRGGFSECVEMSNFVAPDSECVFWKASYGPSIGPFMRVKLHYLIGIPVTRQLILNITDKLERDMPEYLGDLLKYYQARLLDGRTNLINEYGYTQAKNNFRLSRVYASGNNGEHARSLTDDIELLSSAETNGDRLALWQIILTDTELNAQLQFHEHLSRTGDLGPAGGAALKVFEAMIVCQIQASCYMRQHELEALGYDNSFDER